MADGAQSERVDVVRRACATPASPALIAFGLFLPLIGFQTVVNISNDLVLTTRWPLLFAIVAIDRLPAVSLIRSCSRRGWRSARCGRRKPRRSAWRGYLGKWFVPFAIGFVIVYPVIVCRSRSASGGALKWIDNFGIQILIYVMLGWGLNIVVGLAGLLDLGYVAFYAVGAYSYALLAKTFGCRSGCCCRSPASSPRSGASCSAFRCCGCAATISPSSRSPSARSSASS